MRRRQLPDVLSVCLCTDRDPTNSGNSTSSRQNLPAGLLDVKKRQEMGRGGKSNGRRQLGAGGKVGVQMCRELLLLTPPNQSADR